MIVLGVAVAATLITHSLPAREAANPGQTAITVARWLEKGHYSRARLDDAMSEKLLQTYLSNLDYNRLYFTQGDIDEFTAKYADALDDAILTGDLDPAREIYQRFKERVEERVAKAKVFAQQETKFTSNKTVKMNRQKAAWPRDEAEADHLWKEIVESELLRETLSEVKLRTPQEAVMSRYNQVLRNVRDTGDEDIVKYFLNALAQTYDPHSEYLSQSDLENFQISMGLSLVGVGAVLRSEDGYAKIMEVVPGGPADKEGHLKANDRIAGVGQGDAEIEDVVDMRLDKVVEKIRGKKGTIVRLLVIPSDATDPADRRIITIQRDEVKLKDQEAKAELLDLKGPDGKTTRIGWVTLPMFYQKMDRSGREGRSTTADVRALLNRLKAEGMQGLVVDLRRDGGGSLDEAINLTGLFIPQGPVVQSKDSNGKITISRDQDPALVYDGPMIVLMNRLSASASEIFAAALQDYGRAVIVGDERSFGKGTVQTVLELGRLMSPFSLSGGDAGALKLTIQKFYRVKGGSTQLHGVESDIVLPSLTDNPEIGEGSLKNSLPYDEVAPARIFDTASQPTLFLDELRERSRARVAADPEFRYITEDSARLLERIQEGTVSLNLKTRKAEIAADKSRKEARKTERAQRGPALDVAAYEVTLDDLSSKELRPVVYNRKRDRFSVAEEDAEETDAVAPKEAKETEDLQDPDPVRDEGLRIINDLIRLSHGPKTVQTGRDANIPAEP